MSYYNYIIVGSGIARLYTTLLVKTLPQPTDRPSYELNNMVITG